MAAQKTITVCAIALALAAGAPAEAQEAALLPSALVGFGAVTGGCGKWASAPENSVVDIGFFSWLVGFVSGVNALAVMTGRSDFLHGYDGYSLAPWAKNWCRAHPLDQVSNAAEALVAELANRRPQK
jgi:hypothetical protein